MTSITNLLQRGSAYAILAALAAGCAVEPAEPAESASTPQALWAQSSMKFWPDGVVPVCFSRRPDLNLSAWPESDWPRFWVIADYVRALAESTYETLPDVDIDFTGWDLCPDVPNEAYGTNPGVLRIIIQLDKANATFHYRQCPPAPLWNGPPDGCGGGSGYSATREPMLYLNDGSAGPIGSEGFDGALRHELGHALGFDHEYDRDDNLGHAAECGQTSSELSGDFLTVYDPDSSLNRTYCGAASPWLTRLDVLGLEMAYPMVPAPAPFRGSYSFAYKDGIVVAPSDSLAPEWSLRGATQDAFDNIAPVWIEPGVSAVQGWTRPMSALSDGDHVVYLGYQDFRAVPRQTTQSVRKSRRLHAAMLVNAAF